MITTMKAGRFHRGVDGVNKLTIDDVAVPEPGQGQVRIKVMADGVCLTDVHILSGGLVTPFQPPVVTLGHEVSGVIEKLGEGVTDHHVGQRVAMFWTEMRGRDLYSIGMDVDGGWAQYVVVTADLAIDIGPDIPFDQAAIIPDAVSTPWAAITTTAEIRASETVGVWGLGGLGYHAIKLLRLVGAAPIIGVDPIPAARDRALQAGADFVLDPNASDFQQQMLAATSGRGLNAAFDFAGYGPVRQQAFDALAGHGRLVLVGITPDDLVIGPSALISAYGKRILGHYASEKHHVEEIIRLVGIGRLDFSGSITGTYPLVDAQDAIDRLASKAGDPIRLVLIP